jgi:hypothetical protein
MPVSFEKDIRPLFQPIDLDHMRRKSVLLDDYEYMSDPTDDHKNARDVQAFLVGSRQPRMPPDTAGPVVQGEFHGTNAGVARSGRASQLKMER